jgi:hypothetical protein
MRDIAEVGVAAEIPQFGKVVYRLERILRTRDSSRISLADLIQIKGLGLALRWKALHDCGFKFCGTLQNAAADTFAGDPLEKRSAKLSHDAEVRPKCRWKPRWA